LNRVSADVAAWVYLNPADSKQVGPSKDGQLLKPSFKAIEAALEAGDREKAVNLWQEIRQSMNKENTKTALFRKAKQDKSEFYKWVKGKLPNDSATDKALRRALMTD
jgi:hypothetical protein